MLEDLRFVAGVRSIGNGAMRSSLHISSGNGSIFIDKLFAKINYGCYCYFYTAYKDSNLRLGILSSPNYS